ncbi:MAG: metalloenzyme [Deltaproteobacteria bacterium]|nr:metalloenzyme [Deltaproteobacteria bacterium]
MANNFLFIVFDSCRFDSIMAAKTPNISKLGEIEKRWAFASWTMPSHAVYLMGASPHRNPRGVFASEVYKKDFIGWADRLGIEGANFTSFLPQLSVPAFLKEQGYRTNALVSMPVLNQTTILNQHFDRYELMDSHDDFGAIVDQVTFDSRQPSFYFINVGETHYPFTVAGEKAPELLKGPSGVFRHEGDYGVNGCDSSNPDEIYFMDRMKALHDKQIKNVEHLDALFEKLYEKVPKNTHIVVTADHGECFGEEGFFGHGPIVHEKVFEVFLVEGKIK